MRKWCNSSSPQGKDFPVRDGGGVRGRDKRGLVHGVTLCDPVVNGGCGRPVERLVGTVEYRGDDSLEVILSGLIRLSIWVPVVCRSCVAPDLPSPVSERLEREGTSDVSRMGRGT